MKCLIKNTYYKSIPGNNNYLISLNKDIVNLKKEKVYLEKENEFIIIEMYGEKRKVDLEWLALVSHYEVDFPDPFKKRIFEVKFLDCDNTVTRSEIDKIMVMSRSIILYNKYRIIPNFTDYAISKDSELIDVRTGRIIPRFNRGKFNYPEVFIYSAEKNDYKHIKVHRLVALAWIKNIDFISKPIVNHKDSNKQNNHYLNLEWCSYSHNSIHGKSNIEGKFKVVPCVIKNHLTGEVKSFPSFSEVSKFIGVDYRIAPYVLKKYKRPKLFNGFFEIKEEGAYDGWYYDKLSDPLFNCNFTLFLSKESEIIYTFYTINEALLKLNIDKQFISLIDLIKIIKKDFSDYKISFIDDFHLEPIECKDLKTNKVHCAANWTKLAKLINQDDSISRYNKYLKLHDQVKASGFIFRYKSDKPWNEDIQDISIRGKRVIAKNINTNEILIFESHTFAIEYFNIDIKTILRRLNKKKEYNGWIFEGESNNQFYLNAKPVISEKV